MDPEDILHLMTIYKTELQKDLSELEDDVSKLNWPLIKSKLHKMKGDAANLCLANLSDLFAAMETFAQNRDSDNLESQLVSLELLKLQFISAFDQYASDGE